MSGIKFSQRSTWRKWLYPLGLIVSLVCLFYFASRVIVLREGLPTFDGAATVRLSVAVGLCLIASLASAWTWRYLLRLTGVSATLTVAAGIFLTAQFAKYFPGNFAHHIGRVALAERHGIPARRALASMLSEFSIGVSAMLLLSIPVLTRWIQPNLAWVLAGAASIALVGAVAWSRRHDLLGVQEAVPGPTAQAVSVVVWILPITVTASSGLLIASALLVLEPTPAARPDTAVYVVSVFCAAWVAGFVMPGAPAGLGVRELILAEGLAPMVGMEQAATAALLLRVATTLADLFAFAIGIVLLHRIRSGRSVWGTAL